MNIPAPLCPHLEALRVTLEAVGPDEPDNQILPAFRAIAIIAELTQLEPALGGEILRLHRDLLDLTVALSCHDDPVIVAAARKQALMRLHNLGQWLLSAEPSDHAVQLGVTW